MKKILLDTNFMLICIKQKIDFFKELFEIGAEIIIPEQVLQELKNISEDKKQTKTSKANAKLALKIIEKNKYTPLLLEGSYVDGGIIKYAKAHPKIIIATLDRDLQKKAKTRKMIIREKKRLEII